MNRTTFLTALRAGLAGLPEPDIEEILADYRTHFADGESAGRSEDEVAAALGDPARLARELRAEASLRRWERRPSVGNLVGVMLALIGLATVDLLLLIPLLCVLAFFVLVSGAMVLGFALGGLSLLFVFPWTLFAGIHVALVVGLIAVGLLGGAIGGGALLLLVVEFSGALLGRYARLHYRLLDSTAQAV